MRTVLVSGGLGFIGSNFVDLYKERYPDHEVVIVDSSTYAAHPDAVRKYFHKTFFLDLSLSSSLNKMKDIIRVRRIDHIYHFAAETHVCNSIETPVKFFNSNVIGTVHLLEAARQAWDKNLTNKLFYYVSTDEIFGELELYSNERFHPKSPIDPRSPYSASKAGGQMATQAYAQTYGIPTLISCCSNNFGPYQHSEKLVPKTIRHLMNREPVQVYGTGDHVRDWLPVKIHCEAILHLAKDGTINRKNPYLIGGKTELTNLQMIEKIYFLLKRIDPSIPFKTERKPDARPHDDKRYAIDTTDLESTGFKIDPSLFISKLEKTVKWYYDKKFS